MSKVEVDCTKSCRSRLHGQALTSAITKRSVSDESLASYIKSTCANFGKAFDFEGRTALHMTASRGRNGLMKWLVRHSSDAFINARDRESGYTPLHRSIFYGQIHTAVDLMKMGVNTDILDKDDYKALEHAMLDKHYMWEAVGPQPCDAYVWGSNSNYTLGTGSHQPRAVPELLTCFSRINANVKQICLGKFHSVWLCGADEGGEVWCAGQPARAGGPHTTALRPTPLRLAEPCSQVAITLVSTIFLLQSGAVLEYSLNTENSNPSSAKSPSIIKLPSVKPSIKLSNALGVRAGRFHAVVWNANAVYTWGQNLGQLGHSQDDKVVQQPKRVAISFNNKEAASLQLVDAADAATVLTTSRGDVYLLHKHVCKKIAIKQINLRQVCVDAKVNEQGVYSRVTVLMLTSVGQLMIWQDAANRLTRCVFGLNHQIDVTHMALTHDALYFTTKYGEAFVGNISRKTTPAAPQPIKREKEKENKSALVKFLEKDDCTSVRITKITNVHRAVAIAVDGEGLNFACLQMKPTCGLISLPDLSPSSLVKHMQCLSETAATEDILHDVVFKVGSKHYPAHMFIIASSSEYLYKLYRDASAGEDTPTVLLEKVHPDVFERILRYMYTGSCDVAELGPCALNITKEDLIDNNNKETVDTSTLVPDIIENPSEISAFEVYKHQEKRKGRRREGRDASPGRARTHCDPVKLVQATAKRLQVMGLHKLLEKFYYRDGTVHLKESATYNKSSLTWNRDSFTELVDTNVCSKDGIVIPAHKCVLAARLEYFHGMFLHSWSESKILSKVTLPINYGILLPVVNFLYTDTCSEIETSDSIDFICSMLIVADQLFISRLREMCEIALANLLTLKNCTELCQFAHTYNATQLKQCCMEFISLNINNILESRLLDLLEDELLLDISKYYCKFNPIMSSRIITPFYNCPSDNIIEEHLKICPVHLEIVDEDFKKDVTMMESNRKKKQKKIDYTESEKARMRYESVSSVTFLDLSNDTSGDITLSLSSISKEEVKSPRDSERWTKVPTQHQKQQKVVQARLKAISTAKDILNEIPSTSFIKLTKNNSFPLIVPNQTSPNTSCVSPNDSSVDKSWGHGNLIINHVGPKLSQKQRKKLAEENKTSTQTLDKYLTDKLNIGHSTEKHKNPWKVCEAPTATSSPNKPKSIEFNKVLADQKKQKDDFSRIMSKPLALTQLEDKAIEELEKFYNVQEIDDELISVKRIELEVSSPQWIHTAPK